MDKPTFQKPLVRKVDCIRFYVPDLEQGLSFYRDHLGQNLLWRTEHAIGLGMPDADTEIVLQNVDNVQEIDFKVDSVDEATNHIERSGGKVIHPPFDIPVGRCVVVEDPWGNRFVLLDLQKGSYATDENGNVIGNINP